MNHLAADKTVSCMTWPLCRSRLVDVYHPTAKPPFVEPNRLDELAMFLERQT
jgi:hypothetical protein